MEVMLYMALSGNGGWRKLKCKDVEHAHDILTATKRTLGVSHWATCPPEKDDGGITPPLCARIHAVNAPGTEEGVES